MLEPKASNQMTDIVTAFDDALGSVMKRSVVWTIDTIEAFETEHGRTGLDTKEMEKLRPTLETVDPGT